MFSTKPYRFSLPGFAARSRTDDDMLMRNTRGAAEWRPAARLSRVTGFTLLESVVSMVLLGLVLVGAFALLMSSYATMRRTQESVYVTRLLETAIEMTRNLSFPDIAGDPSTGAAGYASVSPVIFQTGSTLLRGTNGEILYSKGVPDGTDPEAGMNLRDGVGRIHFQQIEPDLYRVTAEVSYTSFNGLPMTQRATTYIARQGVSRR